MGPKVKTPSRFFSAIEKAVSIALFTPGGTLILVGAGDGSLKQLDTAGAGPGVTPSVTSVTLGDGSASVGSPSLDAPNDLVYVGTDAGIVYAVQLPLP